MKTLAPHSTEARLALTVVARARSAPATPTTSSASPTAGTGSAGDMSRRSTAPGGQRRTGSTRAPGGTATGAAGAPGGTTAAGSSGVATQSRGHEGRSATLGLSEIVDRLHREPHVSLGLGRSSR